MKGVFFAAVGQTATALPFTIENSLGVTLISMLVVFGVLFSIMLMILIMGALTKDRKGAEASKPAQAGSTAQAAPAAATTSPNDGEIAAITAVISSMVRTENADIKITKV